MMAGDNCIQEEVKVKNRCWNAHITSSIRELYIKTELCDTILTTGNGSQPSNKCRTKLESELMSVKSANPVHKCVVGAVSPYLKSLFKDDPTRYEFNVPLVSDIALKYVLDFVYSGEADVPAQHIDDFFCAAVVLQIESLLFQIKRAVTKQPSHWDQLRLATLNILNPTINTLSPGETNVRRKRNREKSEEKDEFTDTDRSSSVHSNEDMKKDTTSELLQHLIMDKYQKERAREASLSPPRHLPDPVQQPVFPACSQPVFPGQEEPLESDPIHDNNSEGKDSNSNETYIKQEFSPQKSKENGIKIEESWSEYKAPIVIEPSMAYSLYEMAQRHTEVADGARYGFSAETSPSNPPSSNTDADAGPSASSVLRSLLKRKENNATAPAPVLPPPAPAPAPTSASSTLRAMLKQRPLAPPPFWPLPQSPACPTPPPVSSNRLKALLGSPPPQDADARRKDLNGAATEDRHKDKESRKRVADLTDDILDVLKRRRTTPPPAAPAPARTMPAALRLTRSVAAKTSSEPKANDPVKAEAKTTLPSQSCEQHKKTNGKNELVAEVKEGERQPSPHHPILFSILKEQNDRCPIKEEDREEESATVNSKTSSDDPSLAKDSSPAALRPTGGGGGGRLDSHHQLFSDQEEHELCMMIARRLSQGEPTERGDILKLAHEYAIQLGRRDREHPVSRRWYYGFVNRIRGSGGGSSSGETDVLGSRAPTGGMIESLVETAIQDFDRGKSSTAQGGD